MADTTAVGSAWRTELPTLTGRVATLREASAPDAAALVDLLSLPDATRFGVDEPISESAVKDLIERAARERANGVSFTYAIMISGTPHAIGLVQVRQLDPLFEAAEWECTI